MSATPRLGTSFANGTSPSRRFTARTHLGRGVSGESQPSAAVFRVWLHGCGPVKAAKMSMSAVNAFIAGIVWWSRAMNGSNPAAVVLNGGQPQVWRRGYTLVLLYPRSLERWFLAGRLVV